MDCWMVYQNALFVTYSPFIHLVLSLRLELESGEASTCPNLNHFFIAPYNRIEHSTRIRHIRDGQREGLLRIRCVIYGTLFQHIFNI